MQALIDPAPRHIWKNLALVWATILGLMVFYWVSLYQSHQAQLHEAHQQALLRSSQVANALALQTENLFRNLHLTLGHLGNHWAGEDTPHIRREIALAESVLAQGALIQVAIADAKGDIVFSNLTPRQPQPPISIKDRAHFKVHLQADSPQLYISEPVYGRVSGRWVVQLTRPLRSQGKLAYVIVASVPVDYLAEAFRQVLPDTQDVVALLHKNGRYLTRSHGLSEALGKSVPSHLEFLQALDKQNGAYETSAAVDGVVRYYAWQRIAGYPVVLALGLSKEKIMAPVLADVHQSRILNAVVSLLLLVSAAWISYLTLLKTKQNQKLQETRERLRQAVEAARAGLWFLNVDSGEIYWDQHCHEMAGYSQGSLPTRYGEWCALLHPQDRETVEDTLQQHIQSGGRQLISLDCRLLG
ncbi:MAG: PAS domain-containing protein, partial [Simplicispira sp.]|nr:PAS domain-containing protein [Simplicispira sp.]